MVFPLVDADYGNEYNQCKPPVLVLFQHRTAQEKLTMVNACYPIRLGLERRPPVLLALGCLAGILFAGSRLSAEGLDQAQGLRAGAYAQDITPTKFPISVNGNMRDVQATSAHDRLHARCLVLDDGKTRLALVVCDSCMIPRELHDEAKRLASRATGIPADRMLISATHTHTAPTVTGVFQSEPDQDYQQYLVKQIAKGIEKAAANLEPARAGWGVGKDPTQVFNRRWHMKPGSLRPNPFGKNTDTVAMNPGYRDKNPGLVKPAGPTDPDVSFLSVQSRNGRPIAFLANYGLHYVGGVPALSADYFAAFADRMKQLLGAEQVEPPFVGIMSNGTSGDINNVNYAGSTPGRRAPYEQIRLVADSVARAAFDASKGITHRADVTLAMAEKEIELGVRLPSTEDVARAKETLTKARDKKVLTTTAEIYAHETVLLAKYPPKVRAKLQAIRIGGLGIASSPCETFAETGLEVKKKSPLKPTFIIELANGYNGYLPPPGQHRLGGYETWRARSSYLEEGASVKVTETLLELLSQVAR
jgi:hypothetical protein